MTGGEIVWDTTLRPETHLLAFLLVISRAQSHCVSSIYESRSLTGSSDVYINRKLPGGTLQLPTTAIALTTTAAA
jgi:hypothetical protein